MRKLSLAILLLVLAINTNFAEDVKKYGKEITLTEKTQIADILAAPETFEGKTVLVEGTVVGVCSKRGCWIEIAGENEGESIRIKVEDGVIVFPVESKGKKALVEGEVFSVVVPAEKPEGEQEEHEACQEGTKEKKDGDKVYLIQGVGAVIK